jgi:hypothetical protein
MDVGGSLRSPQIILGNFDIQVPNLKTYHRV